MKAPIPIVSSEEVPKVNKVKAPGDATKRNTTPLAASGAQNSFWGQAYDKLYEDDPKIKVFGDFLLSSQSIEASSFHSTTPGELHADKKDILQALANRKLDELSRERYRLSIGDKSVVVRDQLRKVFRVVLTFKDLISSAIAAEPVAAVAWSGIAFVFEVCFPCFLVRPKQVFLAVIATATKPSLPMSPMSSAKLIRGRRC